MNQGLRMVTSVKQTIVKCPTCEDNVIWQASSEYRPFCSKRCQLIDLGEWASDTNRIPESPLVSSMSESELDQLEQLMEGREGDYLNS